jgi:hypothetical protein
VISRTAQADVVLQFGKGRRFVDVTTNELVRLEQSMREYLARAAALSSGAKEIFRNGTNS